MDDYVVLGDSKIGYKYPAYVIAEVGVNHNGDINMALNLIKEAAKSGADCVKFQTFKAGRVVTKDAPKAQYQLKTTSVDESQEDMLKKLEMSMESYKEIIACCKKHNVLFISTPYNIEDVDFLENIGVSAYKLASIHVVEPWFIRYVAKTGKPIILSTGMATLDEVDEAVKVIKEVGNDDLVLLQCTTDYPSKLENTNLRAMQTMADTFGVIVGYSDHTTNNIASIVSIGMGAKVIEKHFTLDKSLPGPDQSTSATPEEFSRLVNDIRSAELVLGSLVKQPCSVEKANMVGMRRSIIAKCNIKHGSVITEGMLTFKRPAKGMSPSEFDSIVGLVAKKDIFIDDFIQLTDFINK